MVQVAYCPVTNGGQDPMSWDWKITATTMKRTAIAMRINDAIFSGCMDSNSE